MERNPHQNPRPGDQFWIGQSSVVRRAASNDGRVVAYTVAGHTYESPIADFRRLPPDDRRVSVPGDGHLGPVGAAMTPTPETVSTTLPDLPRSAPWRLLRSLLMARTCARADRDAALARGQPRRAADAIVNVNEVDRILAVFGVAS